MIISLSARACTGAVFARQAADRGKRVLVIEKRPRIAGSIYTENVEGIHVHTYGAHIFHTNDRQAWDWVNRFAVFNRYTNSLVANYHGELYSLPFNMYNYDMDQVIAAALDMAERELNAEE